MKIKSILILIISITAILTGMIWHVNYLKNEYEKNSALEHARMYSDVLLAFREIYSKEMISAIGVHNLITTQNFIKNKSLPLPITLSKHIASMISSKNSGAKIKIYSPYRFREKIQETDPDVFSRNVWELFKSNSTDSYSEIEYQNGKKMLRYAAVERMSGSCITCHNILPSSPRKTWNKGDPVGIIEVHMSIGEESSSVENNIFQVIIFYMIVALAGTAGIIYFMMKEKMRSLRLEDQVEKRTEELQKAKNIAENANLVKNEFLSRMSHELRTPLNAILGFSQLIASEKVGEEVYSYSKHIINSGKHLLELINEILELSKIELGKIDLNMKDLNLIDELQLPLNMLFPFADTKNIFLSAKLDGLEDIYIFADHVRLRQVLLNLLTNAIKYTPRDGKVEISSQVISDATIRISVTDNGPGLTAEQQKIIFQPFERGDAKFSDIEGTGIGLTISKELMKRMGGSIGLESEPGKGSTFWIDIQLSGQKNI